LLFRTVLEDVFKIEREENRYFSQIEQDPAWNAKKIVAVCGKIIGGLAF
jgi:hypothetical protein